MFFLVYKNVLGKQRFRVKWTNTFYLIKEHSEYPIANKYTLQRLSAELKQIIYTSKNKVKHIF